MTALKTALTDAMAAAARQAGLQLVSTTEGKDFHGHPTAVFELAPISAASATSARTLKLELSEYFDFNKPDLLPVMTKHLSEEAKRLRNPHPDAYVTLEGLPVSFKNFQWPFHRSTSGADTFIVHGEIHLEDGATSGLHAKVATSMTVTFAEIVPAPEQPYAETFLYNAVRKTLDQGQLELVRSGNRQPVPVTTRYYSMKQQVFIFNDTSALQRHDYLAAKVFWLSHVLGGGAPVWIADPRDAQYLNTTIAELHATAVTLAGEGLVLLDGEWAAATDTLRTEEDTYRAQVAEALAFIKPSFNEEMRAGHTNM